MGARPPQLLRVEQLLLRALHRREYGGASRELPVCGPVFSWVLRKSLLTSEPALLVFKVEVMPPALPPLSAAGRITWDNRCELALKAKAAPQEGGVSYLLLCSCSTRVLASDSSPLSQALRTEMCVDVLQMLRAPLAT